VSRETLLALMGTVPGMLLLLTGAVLLWFAVRRR
jgi:hypothetical protein